MGDSEWERVRKGAKGKKLSGPVFSIDKKGHVQFLADLYEKMGEPTAVNVYTDGKRIGFEPTTRGDRHLIDTYLLSVNSNGYGNRPMAVFNGASVVDALGFPHNSKFRAEHDEETGYWILDPENTY